VTGEGSQRNPLVGSLARRRKKRVCHTKGKAFWSSTLTQRPIYLGLPRLKRKKKGLPERSKLPPSEFIDLTPEGIGERRKDWKKDRRCLSGGKKGRRLLISIEGIFSGSVGGGGKAPGCTAGALVKGGSYIQLKNAWGGQCERVKTCLSNNSRGKERRVSRK